MRYRLPLLMLVLVASSLCAGGEGEGVPSEFWLNSHRTGVAAAAQLVAAGDRWTAAALRLHAFDQDLWHEVPSTLDRVPPLHPHRLAAVLDGRAFPRDEHKLPEEFSPQEREEDALYWQAVLYAAKVPADVFAKAAQPNRYLSFDHLYSEPVKYRGRVVHFSGRLGRLKRLDPPPEVQARGIGAIYEAWVFLDQPDAGPLCVIMPHAPAGVALGDDQGVRVDVDGYFFKRYGYLSGRVDAKGHPKVLLTVMLIAPTLTPITPAPSSWSAAGGGSLFWWIVGFGIGVAAFMAVMTWWFRRNDRLVQARLQAVRASRYAEQAAELQKTLTPSSETANGPQPKAE